MRTPEAPSLDEIRAARERIAADVVRTPLLALELDGSVIHLKLECLQPIGSFKLRGASNAIACRSREALAKGVWTASAGNMAQGVAWQARRRGIPCAVVVPDNAPEAKLSAIRRLGARIVPAPFEQWWRALETGEHPGMEGAFIHPVADSDVMAGNGTIGLEIVEDLPDVDTVLVPYGGGGLSCGIAAAVKALRPNARVIACEIETAAPLGPSLAAGAPVAIEHRTSFVDGIGAPSLLAGMWPLARRLLDGACAVSLEETAAAIRMLVERARIVAEGAGAVPVAAAMSGRAGGSKVACVVSGGNIDPAKLSVILAGRLP